MMLFKRRWLAKADAALQADDLDAAETLTRRELERSPGNRDARHLLGRILLFDGRLEEAREIYERLLEEESSEGSDAGAARENLRQTHLRIAFRAREADDLDGAADAYRAALELSPDDPFIYYNLGCAYAGDSERLREAADAWGRAAELRPDYVEARYDLAQYHFSERRYAEARPHFEAAAAAREDWPAPRYCLAAICVQEGRLEEALERLREALELNIGWANSAAADPLMEPLRGNPAFEEMIQQNDRPLDVLTPEDLLRDMREMEEAIAAAEAAEEERGGEESDEAIDGEGGDEIGGEDERREEERGE